jgi:hypothetical protein
MFSGTRLNNAIRTLSENDLTFTDYLEKIHQSGLNPNQAIKDNDLKQLEICSTSTKASKGRWLLPLKGSKQWSRPQKEPLLGCKINRGRRGDRVIAPVLDHAFKFNSAIEAVRGRT